ncbi:MAG: PQQ-binding-like beta-propeller repeat protein [Opitutales bacterium]|nr:PQQ-binding-like beta-propeller repeat protein [Opitutales bacterium]
MTYISLDLGVIPLAVGPLQALLAVLPAILVGIGTAIVALFKPSTFVLLFKTLWRMKVTVVLAVALGWAAWQGAKFVFPGVAADAAAAEAGESDWPLFRGDEKRSGAVPGTASPAAGGLNWRATNGVTAFSSPVVMGNRVFIVQAEFGFFKNESHLAAYDADSGAPIWRIRPPGMEATFSSISIKGDYLAVGEGLHETKDARLFVYRFRGDEEPELLWIYQSNGHMESTPHLHEGRVYIGTSYRGWYCFELEPDEDGNPIQVWNTGGEGYADSVTSPVVSDGKFYGTQGIQGHAVVCLDADTGEELWRVETPAPVFTSVTLVNGMAVAGYGHGNFIFSAEEVRQARPERLEGQGRSQEYIEEHVAQMKVEGGILAIDTESGEVLWHETLPRTIVSPIAATEDRLIAGNRDGVVRSFSFDGDLLAEWNSGNMIVTAPAVTDEFAYVLADGGFLYALDLDTLAPVWSFTVGEPGIYASSPTVARGQVYFATPQSPLISVGEPLAAELQYLWDGPLGIVNRGNRFADGALGGRGAFRWNYLAGEEAPAPRMGPIASSETMNLVPIAEGPEAGLIAFDTAARPEEKWRYQASGKILGSPAIRGERAFLLEDSEAEGKLLLQLSLEDGSVKDTLKIEEGASGFFRLGQRDLWVEREPGILTAQTYEGEARWNTQVGSLAGPPIPLRDHLLAHTDDSSLVVLDRHSGEIIWHRTLEEEIISEPLQLSNRIFVGTTDGLLALRLGNGEKVWQVGDSFGGDSMLALGNFLYFVDAEGVLRQVDRRSGEVMQEWEGANPKVSPFGTRDRVFFVEGNFLQQLNPRTGDVNPWMNIGWLGEILSPFVVRGENLYFSTDQRGLIRAGRR